MSEPHFDYYQEFEILGNLLYPMARISDELLQKLADKKFYIDIYLYAKFVLTAFSLSKLLPVGKTPQQNAAADIASVSSLARNLIEIYNFLYYLRLDEISNEEAEFRRLVATYHYAHEQHKIGAKMEVNVEELIKHKENELEFYKARIESHPFFETMQAPIKKKILKGESAIYLRRTQIIKNYCSSYKLLDALYKVMSNHVHSGIYGFVTSFDGKTFGCDSDRNRAAISNLLYLVNYYIGLAIASILIIYPESRKYMPKESTELVKKLVERF